MSRPTILSAPELADLLGISVDAVQRRARKGLIPSLTTGGRERRFLLSDVLAAMGAGRVTARPRPAPTSVVEEAPLSIEASRAFRRMVRENCDGTGRTATQDAGNRKARRAV